MKKDIAEYVAICDVCQRVKAEYQKPAGLLQQLVEDLKELHLEIVPIGFVAVMEV